MGESAAETAALPTQPLLKPWYRLSVDSDAVVLRFGSSVLEFGGGAATRLLPHLLPLLDGTRTLEQLVAALGEPIRPAVESALALLARQGLLIQPAPPGTPPRRRRAAEFLAATDSFSRPIPAAVDALAAARVLVLGTGPVATATADLLERSGVGSVRREGFETDATADLTVVAPSAREVPLVEAWNVSALARGTTWLQVLPFDGLLAAVGPIYVPRATPCYECYRLRRSACIGPIRDTATGDYASSPAFDALLAGLAATVALRRLGLADGLHLGVLLAVERGHELGCTRHVVHRVPRCPACSPAARLGTLVPWHGAADVAA